MPIEYSGTIDYNSETTANADAAHQTEEQKEIAKKVMALYQRGLQNMQRRHRLWRDNYEFFLGAQWPVSRPSYRASEVLNYTFAAIESALPILTDTRPRFTYLPEDPGDQELAKYFDKIATATWNKEGWNLVVSDLYLTGMLYGNSFPSMKFDPNANSGVGKIRFLSVDPFQLYFDDNAIDINDGSCAWVLQATPLSVGKVKTMFPDYAEFIKPDLTPSVPSKYSIENNELIDGARIMNYPGARVDSASTYLTKNNTDNKVMVYELWIDDDTMHEVMNDCRDEEGNPLYEDDGVTQKKEKSYEKKFPDGRRTIVVCGLAVDDGNNEYKDGKYPYAKYTDYQLPQEFFGMGDVDNLKGPQRMVNRAICSFLDNMTYMGNPIWVMDQGAIDADMLTNAPGLVVEKVPGMEARREPGLPLPSGSSEIFAIASQAFDRIYGSNEISQGVRASGVTSGVAIESLQEAAQTRLRLKARNMEVTLTQIGELFLSRVMQFWTQPQFVSIASEGAPPEVFKFQIEKDPEFPGWYQAIVDPYGEKDGKLVPTGEQKKFKTKGLFDVKVSIGSNLPFAKKEKADRAVQFYQLGLVDEEEVLKAAEWPGYERVLQRLTERKQQAALQGGSQNGKTNA